MPFFLGFGVRAVEARGSECGARLDTRCNSAAKPMARMAVAPRLTHQDQQRLNENPGPQRR